jgi:endoglucanase
VAAAAALAAVTALAGNATAGPTGTAFYAPGPNPSAQQQIAKLTSAGQRADAALVAALAATPHAVWITGGTPNDARVAALKTVNRAAGKDEVPVLVLYDIPFRDCAQYSAGGATDTASYEAWVNGVAAGIGGKKAVVLLEPDSLGIIPFYTQFMGWGDPGTAEWCQPRDAGGNPLAGADPAHRFAQLTYAVKALKALPNASVYLDGTHSGWLGAGDAADRLIKADVADADGFFLNVSNYELTSHLVKYGTWISKCIATSLAVSWWHPYWCASQYYPATASDFTTWTLTDAAYADLSWAWGGSTLKHFVVDTSRNGQGPWTPPAGAYTGDPQVWCNPPGRGAGVTPTTNTGNPLVDAFVWAKVPGESDGSCNRSVAGATTDPEWGGIVDPAAGDWFPQQALQLAQLASPALH